ncbi:odorant receptor Or1-like [Megalopta genalis]|uniref:odorant receptor Or1-like n=1 Tax=Megalopta genalis TaxID=115081 RepID=UPI003FD5BEC4
MPTLRCASTVLTMIGCHRPSSWRSGPVKFLYKAYGVVVLILVQTLTLVSVLDVVFNVQNQDEFSDNLVLTLPMLITCCKFCNFLTHGNSIMLLIDTLQKKPYSPDNNDEMNIETRHDKHNEKISAVYMLLSEVCIVMILITTLLTNGKNRMLAYRLWIPFDYSATAVYAVVFFLQAVSVIIASLMNVTYDALFSGLMFCIHSQLEILGLRLQNVMENGEESATECARHHNFLYEFAAKVNEDFQAVLCFQFMASIATICFTLYRITQTDLGERLASTLVYAFCMLIQIFYYCWYGNEVKRKSLEVPDWIFASNWASLSDNTKKTLLMIMIRATYPIEFTTAHILSVNIESFMAVLKTSYSVYNVLQ